jgi:predicted nicotinamide N-methyase|uniref:Methyltransferase small domain-containing protein n=1 Tax=Globisporangium ultimum (strain ATCC 200006 / CBS 805.95 / DAOM BR144) TaxID=431595 RepID=K3WBE9_GLOUD
MDAAGNAGADMATAMEGSIAAASGGHQDPQAAGALVPFSFRNPFHDALRDATRWFPLAGTHIRIDQCWKPDGRGGTAIGFGASVYDAAIMLSLYLDNHRDAVFGKRVVELGAGPGLVGIAAAHCGAKSVVITDGDPASVALTHKNIGLNGLDFAEVSAQQYLWGEQDHPLVVKNESAFDVILGADIVACPYAGAFESLLQAFRDLAGSNTLLLLAYKLRHGSESSFFTKFKAYFDVEQVPASELHADFQQGDIVLYRARLKRQSNNAKTTA